MQIERTQEEINRVINWTWEPPHYPGMTYEDGVRAAIDWIMGVDDTAPDSD